MSVYMWTSIYRFCACVCIYVCVCISKKSFLVVGFVRPQGSKHFSNWVLSPSSHWVFLNQATYTCPWGADIDVTVVVWISGCISWISFLWQHPFSFFYHCYAFFFIFNNTNDLISILFGHHSFINYPFTYLLYNFINYYHHHLSWHFLWNISWGTFIKYQREGTNRRISFPEIIPRIHCLYWLLVGIFTFMTSA